MVNDSDKYIEITTKGGHVIKLDDGNSSITIKSTGNLTLEAGANLTFKANGSISVEGGGDLNLAATANVNVGGAKISLN